MYKYILWFTILACLTLVAQAQQPDTSQSVTRGAMLNPELSLQPEAAPILEPRALERQPLYTSIDRALVEPEKVYRLDLSGQRLREFPTQIFRLVNLQELDLSDNKLDEMPDNLSDLGNLQMLNLTDNKLHTLPAEMREMENLERLYLGENRIMEMPAWLGGVSKLRYIDLHRNYITLYEVQKLRERLPHCEIAY